MKRIGAPVLRRLVGGQPDEAGELIGDRQQGVHGGAVALAPQLDAEREGAVLDEGEGMRGIDRDRRQDRQMLAQEVLLEPFALEGVRGRPARR